MEVTWVAGEYHIGQGSTVCSRDNEGAQQEIRN